MFYKTLFSLCFIKVFITIAYGESNPGYHGTGGDIQPDRPLIVGNCFDRIYAESVQCIAEAHRKWNLEFNYLAPVPGDPTTRESCCSGWQTFDCYEREITVCFDGYVYLWLISVIMFCFMNSSNAIQRNKSLSRNIWPR